MSDLAHKLTDEELDALEKKIRSEFERAAKAVEERATEFFSELQAEGDALLQAIKDAPDDAAKKLAGKKYGAWLRDKTLSNKRFAAVRERIANDLLRSNEIAADLISGRMNRVFALNHNYAAYDLEHGLGLNLRFDLYDESTVARLLRDNPELLPKPKIDIPADLRWNQSKITSEISQGIISGESIPKIAARLQNVVGMNATSAIRNARTAMTGAQNAGRIESYHYAQSIGITLKKEWLATLDMHTRDEHRLLDGQKAEIDEPFHVLGDSIMYPGDPNAPGYLVYGCRCTLISAVDGVDELEPVYRRDNISGELIEDKSYAEWEQARKGIFETVDDGKPIEIKRYSGYQLNSPSYIIGGNDDAYYLTGEADGVVKTIPSNATNDVIVYGAPKTDGFVNGVYVADNNENVIMSEGRIVLNSDRANNSARASIRDMVESECARLGGATREGVFFRGTNNKGEIALVESGKIRPSVNHMTGVVERGLSVMEGPAYGGFDYYYTITGKIVGTGSDGENVLDVSTLRVVERFDDNVISTFYERRKSGEEIFMRKYGWTREQLDAALKGNYGSRIWL